MQAGWPNCVTPRRWPRRGSSRPPTSFARALRDFCWAIARRNLRELACSPVLHAHYDALRRLAGALAAEATPFDVLALAGRPVPPATLAALPAERLAHLRAAYEAALLAVLRDPEAPPAAALEALDTCLAALAGPDPYDYWRLARACLRALHGAFGSLPQR